MSEPDFTVDIYQNEYLPEGGRDVNAVVTVATAGTVSAAPAPGVRTTERPGQRRDVVRLPAPCPSGRARTVGGIAGQSGTDCSRSRLPERPPSPEWPRGAGLQVRAGAAEPSGRDAERRRRSTSRL